MYEITDVNAAAAAIKSLNDKLACGFLSNDVQVRIRRFPTQIEVVYRDGHPYRQAASFALIEQPNCCGVLVSTRAFVADKYQGQGVGQALMELKEAIAREFGYSCLAATVRMDNPVEIHILEKRGWVKGFDFLNDRTNHQVGFFFKDLH